MSHTFPECEKFVGRKKAICRGEVELPLNGPNSINAYRLKEGLIPLGIANNSTNAAYVPKVHAPEPVSSNTDPKLGKHVGTNLALLLKACGIHVKDGCTCEEWIAKMNAWTIAENYEHRQEIIDHLADRAKQEKMSIKKKFWTGVLMAWNGMLPMISELVDEAIFVAKDSQNRD